MDGLVALPCAPSGERPAPSPAVPPARADEVRLPGGRASPESARRRSAPTRGLLRRSTPLESGTQTRLASSASQRSVPPAVEPVEAEIGGQSVDGEESDVDVEEPFDDNSKATSGVRHFNRLDSDRLRRNPGSSTRGINPLSDEFDISGPREWLGVDWNIDAPTCAAPCHHVERGSHVPELDARGPLRLP